jgi:hypothetical protein
VTLHRQLPTVEAMLIFNGDIALEYSRGSTAGCGKLRHLVAPGEGGSACSTRTDLPASARRVGGQ